MKWIVAHKFEPLENKPYYITVSEWDTEKEAKDVTKRLRKKYYTPYVYFAENEKILSNYIGIWYDKENL